MVESLWTLPDLNFFGPSLDNKIQDNLPIFKDGKPSGEKCIDASILIPWGYIASIVHFPGEEGFDFPDPFATNLGFNINNE